MVSLVSALLLVVMALQKFQLPPSTSRWKRKLYYFLRNKLKLPGEFFGLPIFQDRLKQKLIDLVLCDDDLDIILMGLFSLSLKMWAIIILWFILAPIAHRWDLGPIFVSPFNVWIPEKVS